MNDAMSSTTRWIGQRSDARDELIITNQLVVIGAGGHGRELVDIVRAASAASSDVELLGVADDGLPDFGLLARSGIRYLGNSDAVLERDVEILIGIGDPATRERIDHKAPERSAAPMIHPTATVGSDTVLQPGVVLAQEATVTTNVHLGRHTHLNVGSSVSHDCRVGDYVTICPGVRVTGNVTVGDRVFIGTGAVILPGMSVGHDAVIGAGAVVCEHVPPAITVMGIPAR